MVCPTPCRPDADDEIILKKIKVVQQMFSDQVGLRYEKRSETTGVKKGRWNIKEGCTHSKRTVENICDNLEQKAHVVLNYCQRVNQMEPGDFTEETLRATSGKTYAVRQYNVPSGAAITKQELKAPSKQPISWNKLRRRYKRNTARCKQCSTNAPHAAGYEIVTVADVGTQQPDVVLTGRGLYQANSFPVGPTRSSGLLHCPCFRVGRLVERVRGKWTRSA